MLKRALKIIGAVILAHRVIGYAGRIFHLSTPSSLGFILDNPIRKMMLSPETVVERSGIQPGMILLDLGCGNGAYTPAFARAVGEGGIVYAVDRQQGMLEQLQRKLERRKYRDITNIRVIEADAYKLPFPDNFFDMVCTVGVIPEIPDRERAVKEIFRILKPGGILADTEHLPDPDYPLKRSLIETVETGGLTAESSRGNLWAYTVRFRKDGTPETTESGQNEN